jgi:hypothetical protein
LLLTQLITSIGNEERLSHIALISAFVPFDDSSNCIRHGIFKLLAKRSDEARGLTAHDGISDIDKAVVTPTKQRKNKRFILRLSRRKD